MAAADGEAHMITFRAKDAPGICTHKGSGCHEIRWDVVGCNLRCQVCWSPASRPEELKEKTISKDANEILKDTLTALKKLDATKTFIRFTGGEPSLYWDNLSNVFALFENDEIINSIPILIQTNGIEIGKGVDLTHVSKTKQKYLFEVSFKGTNKEEFSLLSGKEPDLFEYQIQGYNRLIEISAKNRNVAVIAVLGVYHSAAKIKGLAQYAFVNPQNGTILFEDKNGWQNNFSTIWLSARLKWVERLKLSPKGMWDKVFNRCGPSGTGILREYSPKIEINASGLFPAKPDTAAYAKAIVQRQYWM